MTYDVHLRRREELGGGDPTKAFETLLEGLEDEEVDLDAMLAARAAPASSAVKRELEAARDALLAANPRFTVLGSLEESSSIQLDSEESTGVLVDLDPGEIGLVVSYGTDDPGSAARDLAACIGALAPLGWVAYDPQLERVVAGDERDRRETTALISEIHADLIARYGKPGERPRSLFAKLLRRS